MRVAVLVVATIRSLKVLHEQDESASAFWIGAYLLAWPGSLLGRDTATTTSDPKSSARKQSGGSEKNDQPKWHNAVSALLAVDEPAPPLGAQTSWDADIMGTMMRPLARNE